MNHKLNKNLSHRLLEIFYVDLRSLALLRIGIGSALILDILFRATTLVKYYTDSGIFPRSLIHEVYGDRIWSLHSISGAWQFEAFLFLLQALFAVMLLAGFKTKISSIISFILLLSIQNRNPVVLYGGDFLLKMTLFWGIFIPWGARFSIDSINPVLKKLPSRVFTFGILGYFLQTCFIYLFAAASKSGLSWTTDNTAVFYVLMLKPFATPLAGFVVQNFSQFLPFLTIFVRLLEILAPFLILSPFYNSQARIVAIALLIFMHLSFGATLFIGLFPFISIVSLFGLLPSYFWDRLVPLAGKVFGGRGGSVSQKKHFSPKTQTNTESRKLFDFSTLSKVICLGLIIYILGFNMSNIGLVSSYPRTPGYLIGVNQQWTMFAPSPPDYSLWYGVTGKLRNGKSVDMPINASMFDLHKNYLWISQQMWILDSPRLISTEKRDKIWKEYASYLCKNFKANGDQKNVVLSSLKIYAETQKIPLTRDSTQPKQKTILYSHSCN